MTRTSTRTTRSSTTMTLRAALALALATGLGASLTACGDEEEEVTPTIKKKEDEGPKEEAPVDPKAQQDLAYTYNATNRRDPFKTYFDELSTSEERDQQNLTDLQRVDIDKLKLTAVVVGTATPMAMVEEQSGKGHVVKIGTLIGKRLGQVKHIRRGEIVIQEEYRDFTGKRIPHLTEMKIEEKQ